MATRQRTCEADCGSSFLSRRRFLAGCAACAAGGKALAALGEEKPAAKPAEKARVRLVFVHIPPNRPTWPNIGYDYDGRKKDLTAKLTRACGNIEFLPATVGNQNQAKKLLAEDKKVDGYLVYTLGIWTGAPQVIGASGRPALFVDDLYGGSGEFLVAFAAARRHGWKVAGVSSSRFEDVARAARCFEVLKRAGGSADAFVAACTESRRKSTKAPGDLTCRPDVVKAVPVDQCLQKLRASTILAVGGGWGNAKAITDVFGTKVLPVKFKELHEAFLKADRGEARKWADRWTTTARKVVEPKKEDLEKSGAMHVAMLELLKRHKAQAITINCLGGFYGGHLKAYPCLGFCELNDAGLVGACEGDLTSTITMLAMGALTGRPGFISDPVIDTSKNQIIYAHCVAPTKVFGPGGPANPYDIRSHSEDRKGAATRSLMPLGHMTTTLEIEPGRRGIILHQGKTVENIDEDKACRTKLAAEVKGDIDKLLGEWDRWGWHRVTFYGDLKGPVRTLAKALKFRLVEEA